nr:MAG TPA: hypothetical protein [Caudoviricetes sp.]
MKVLVALVRQTQQRGQKPLAILVMSRLRGGASYRPKSDIGRGS